MIDMCNIQYAVSNVYVVLKQHGRWSDHNKENISQCQCTVHLEMLLQLQQDPLIHLHYLLYCLWSVITNIIMIIFSHCTDSLNLEPNSFYCHWNPGKHKFMSSSVTKYMSINVALMLGLMRLLVSLCRL